MRRIARLVALGGWVVLGAWVTWWLWLACGWWGPILARTREVRLGVDAETGEPYGLRITPLRSRERAAAARLEQLLEEDPWVFATGA